MNIQITKNDLIPQGCDGRYLWDSEPGELTFNGATVHVSFIRVTYTNDEEVEVDEDDSEGGEQRAYHAVHPYSSEADLCYCVSELEAMYEIDPNDPFNTIKILGLEGDYVVHAEIGK
jgi:hypothetical protein